MISQGIYLAVPNFFYAFFQKTSDFVLSRGHGLGGPKRIALLSCVLSGSERLCSWEATRIQIVKEDER